ncbi:PadR family transcriptional regulator [Actinomyces ruminis]|uniref:PadR family transcriptional regulator n=1 Tax=Actinomyces ruminis TaxID=1937003 RepID=A0ABX4MEC5_9ACTO|nr:PadR family transcriptional regulator [Actinomyces ruminis]PHP53811.1 PadR family transcriptional regulator [Actinomyces ruminis]
MLELKILGFLDEGPLHGYELRRRIIELDGPGGRLSEGALYPALTRMEKAGLLVRNDEPGARGRPRRRIEITAAGRERLHELLRHPSEADVSSMPRFLILLAFLSHLPDHAEREAVLRRRLEVLREPAPAFFYDDGAPRRAAAEADPYRRGMIRVVAASRRAELEWLQQELNGPVKEVSAPAPSGKMPERSATPPRIRSTV